MSPTKSATEEDVFDLQIGLGGSKTSVEDKHFFDTAGYLVLGELLTADQVSRAQDMLARIKAAPPENITSLPNGSYGCELVNIIEGSGTVEDAMALPRILRLCAGIHLGTPIPSRRLTGNTQNIGEVQQTHPRW